MMLICNRCGALHDDGSIIHCLDCIEEIIAEGFSDKPKTDELENEEISIILQHYSLMSTVDDIEKYLAMKEIEKNGGDPIADYHKVQSKKQKEFLLKQVVRRASRYGNILSRMFRLKL